MQRPNPGEPFLPTPAANGFTPPAGFGGPPPGFPGGYLPQPVQGGFPGQFPASPFAVANPTAPGTGRRNVPSVAELFHAFKRRWVLVLMVGGLLGAVMAAGVWMAMPSGKHQVRALVQMRTEAPNISGRAHGYNENEFDRFKEGELATIKTKGFLASVAAMEEVARQPLIANSDDKARSIEWLLTHKWESPEILALMMNGDDANQLKVILTNLVNKYVQGAVAAQTDERARNLGEIDAALKEMDKKIKERRDAMERIVKERGSDGGGTAIEKLVFGQQLTAAISDLKRHTEKKNELDIRLAQLEAEKTTGEYIVDPDLLASRLSNQPTVAARQQEADAIQRDLANMKEKMVGNSPKLVEMENNYRKALAAVEAERNAVRETLLKTMKADRKQTLAVELKSTEFQLKIAAGLADAARKDKEAMEKRIKDVNEGNVAQLHERGDLDPLVDQRNELAKQKNQLEFVDAKQKPRVELKEGAQVYMNYNLKQKMVMATLAGVVGLLGVLLLISFLEWRNRRVDGVDQVVTELGMRVIGTIPAFPSRASLRSGDAGANQNWRFILNESVNSTRTMLLHTAKTQQMQIIMVTSAMQGEGKTSLSSQLATSMATAGLRTLILDFDLRNPSMQKLFDVRVAPGCCEVLLQEVDVSDCVQPTSVPNLWILPAGQCNHRVIAALAQGNPVEQLLTRLRDQFDVIVVDSCPILPVADSLLVAQHVDGVVFSILQDVSQLPKVMDASEKLVQLNIPLLGAVVNGIKPDIQAYGYNYVKQLPA